MEHTAKALNEFMPPPVDADPRPSLVGRTLAEIGEIVAGLGEKPFRAKQLYHWIYVRGARDFDAMSNIGKALRAALIERYSLARPAEKLAQQSADGTRKWLLSFGDGNEAESVFIPEASRGTLCVSSQVGCTLACRFCHTGTQTLVRNLTPAEIVGQFMIARDTLGEWPPETAKERRLTNIVMMGMGEPLYNFENVAAAMKLVMDPDGLGFSRRRITLSTAGVVPMMARAGEELGVNLAVSLHAVDDETRDEIVPLNKKYPIAELLAACRAYPGVNNARRITFEYVMLKGVNDSDADARALVRHLKDIPAKINLIPFNPWPGAAYECSDPARIEAFADIAYKGGLTCTVRTPRGQDIMAACGQLKSASERVRKSARG